jgi:TRAP-type C4-dicarboxylate transport system substrate-binding protein
MVGQMPGRFPTFEVVGVPLAGANSAAQASAAAMELFQTTPEIQKEFPGVHVLFVHSTAPQQIATVKKKVTTMADLKGLRIRTQSGFPLSFMQALGGTPVTVPAPEMFESLQKGVIDGVATDWSAILSFKLNELVKYVVDEPKVCASPMWLIMNQKKWDSLPPDLQKIFTDEAGNIEAAKSFGSVWDVASAKAVEDAKKNGIEMVKLSPDELANWQKTSQPVVDKWVTDMKAKGVDAAPILEKYKGLLKKYAQ